MIPRQPPQPLPPSLTTTNTNTLSAISLCPHLSQHPIIHNCKPTADHDPLSSPQSIPIEHHITALRFPISWLPNGSLTLHWMCNLMAASKWASRSLSPSSLSSVLHELIKRLHESPDARGKWPGLAGMDEGYTIDPVVEYGRLSTLFSTPD